MQKLFTLLCAALISISSYAQNKASGRVVDEEGQGLPFVNIRINSGKFGGTTDLDGYFDLNAKEPISNLNFSYIGFESKKLSGSEILEEGMNVVLIEKSTTLGEVTVLPGENPAHRIVNRAVANKKLNDPQSLEEFSYFSYSKFFVTLVLDSVDPSIDTIMLSDRIDSLSAETTDSIVRIDSSGYNLHDFFSNQHLFFMETLTERKVKKPRDNEEVLANRTSGFKNPMFAMLVTQMQSFSFYQDYIGISGGEYLNPISKGSTKRYYFIIEDSLFTESGDTIFTLSFRPRPNTGFKALEGVINIDSRDWAIVNLRATPASADALPIEIRQEYKRFGPHTWFPTSFEADIKLKMVEINDATPMAIMRRKLMRINLNPGLDRSSISRNDLTIEEKDQEEVDSLLNAFRGYELDSVEQNTYTFIDSLSEAENLEQNLNLLLTLQRGYIPLYWVNLDLGSIVNYNTYEGFRLGLGVETRRDFIDWMTLGGYYAYGFGDKAHKYGGNIRIELIKNLRWELFADYKSDLFETSGFDIPSMEKPSLFENSYRRLYIEQWDYSQRLRGGMRIDPFPTINIELAAQHERRSTTRDYLFVTEDEIGSTFRFSELTASIRYAPAEEYAETPFGKIKLKQRYPVFNLHYARGSSELWDADFDYHRLMLQADYKHLTRGFGETSLRLRSAVVIGDVPAAKLFSPAANYRNEDDIWTPNIRSFADRNSFETMRFNEFLNDRFISLMWRQDFRSIFFRKGDFAPHLEMVHRLAFGSLEDPSPHLNLVVQDLRKGFFESGLEFNRLYTSNFFAAGIGLYYRYGPYQLPEAIDNFAFKLSSKFSF
ncbi:MAG: DUF5686 and carboxypeptidase regulatory-like domain-containing protein [Bacteroidetes bacterium]|nr:DUF5686 and carboxypeptidase regulatory-like domain-containing protein [Bacteroidota bacterium]